MATIFCRFLQFLEKAPTCTFSLLKAFTCVFTEKTIHYTLELLYRSAAASHFGRPGKSAAAAAITLSTQGVNEHQIKLKQNNLCRLYICIFFIICPQVMGDFSSQLIVVKRRIFVDYWKKQIRNIFLAWKKSNCSEFVVIIQFAAHLPPVLTVWWPTKVTRGGRSVQQL